jgi:hypothetical protein
MVLLWKYTAGGCNCSSWVWVWVWVWVCSCLDRGDGFRAMQRLTRLPTVVLKPSALSLAVTSSTRDAVIQTTTQKCTSTFTELPATSAELQLTSVGANTVASFFSVDPASNHTQGMILCHLSHLLPANKFTQYTELGIGSPVDRPVSLGYFTSDRFQQVDAQNMPRFDQLLNHVRTQLDGYDMTLLPTPVALTLQGDFDEEEEYDEGEETVEEDDFDEDRGARADERRSTDYVRRSYPSQKLVDAVNWPLLLRHVNESIAQNPHAYTADTDEDEEDQEVEENEHRYPPTAAASGFRLIAVNNLSAHVTIPEDALVTDGDEQSLRESHRYADQVFDRIADHVRLIGSFHFGKRNYHLVQWLEVGDCGIVVLACCSV